MAPSSTRVPRGEGCSTASGSRTGPSYGPLGAIDSASGTMQLRQIRRVTGGVPDAGSDTHRPVVPVTKKYRRGRSPDSVNRPSAPVIAVATGSGGSAITGPSGNALVKARTLTCASGAVWWPSPDWNVTTRPEMANGGRGVPDPDPAI